MNRNPPNKPRLGDMLIFTRLTFAQAFQGGLASFFGYLSNLLIAFWQWENQGNKDGAASGIHVGFIGGFAADGEPLVAEFTAGQKGPGMKRLCDRAAAYPGGIWLLPLKPEYRAKLSEPALQSWLSNNRDTLYNYFGLPFACNRWLKGVHFDGRLFCSEACFDMLIETGVLARQYPAFSGKRYQPVRNCPHWNGPADVTRLPIIDRSEIRLLN